MRRSPYRTQRREVIQHARFGRHRHRRHSAVTVVYRATRDLFLAQRFARHASPLTTVIYTHVSDEEMFERLHGMEC